MKRPRRLWLWISTWTASLALALFAQGALVPPSLGSSVAVAYLLFSPLVMVPVFLVWRARLRGETLGFDRHAPPSPAPVPASSGFGEVLGFLFMAVVYLGGAAGVLYLVVRFVKWAWQG